MMNNLNKIYDIIVVKNIYFGKVGAFRCGVIKGN